MTYENSPYLPIILVVPLTFEDTGKLDFPHKLVTGHISDDKVSVGTVQRSDASLISSVTCRRL